MKNLILLLAPFAVVIACQKEVTSARVQLESKLELSYWEVTYYSTSDEDLSHLFKGSKLEFTTDGIIKISGSGDNYDGRWTVTDHSTDHKSDLHVNLTFESLSEFLRLTNNWELSLETQYRIELVKASSKLILTQIQ